MIDDSSRILESIDRRLAAVLALMVERVSREDGAQAKRKPRAVDVVLAAGGLGLKSPDIAKVLGKKETAVRKAIERSRSGGVVPR